jgi:hypothetical protein
MLNKGSALALRLEAETQTPSPLPVLQQKATQQSTKSTTPSSRVKPWFLYTYTHIPATPLKTGKLENGEFLEIIIKTTVLCFQALIATVST